jgi:hypothetical protein
VVVVKEVVEVVVAVEGWQRGLLYLRGGTQTRLTYY